MPSVACTACGTSNREGVKFCTSCGARLSAAAAPAAVPASSGGTGPAASAPAAAPEFGSAVYRWFTLENCAFALLVFVTLVTRVWDSGGRPLHHDESLHATYSYYLFHEGRYAYEPMMHGPFQFHLTALIYFLFGANDWSARIPPALFGTFLVAIPFFLKRELGRVAALWTAFVLFASASFFYYSRFLREDIYTAGWTFAAVAAGLKYAFDRKDRYLYACALFLSFSFCTKESSFITVFIFGNFLMVRYNWDLLARLGDGVRPFARAGYVLLLLASWAVYATSGDHGAWLKFGLTVLGVHLLFGALHVGVLSSRVRLLLADLQTHGRLVPWFAAILLGIFSFALLRDSPSLKWVLLGLAGVFGALAFLRRSDSETLGRKGVPAVSAIVALAAMGILAGAFRARGHPQAAFASVGGAIFLVAIVGYYLQSFRLAFGALVAFLVPFTLLFTTFGTNLKGFWDGYYSGLEYWLTQQKVERGSQPYYYYAFLLLLYELPSVVLSVLATIRALRRPAAVPILLVFWAAMSMIMYSLAGERMPWLVLHVALPLTVLSAWYVGDRWNAARGGRGGWIAVLLASAAIYAHGSFVLVYFRGADPNEPLVYVQTSEDVNKVVDQVNRLSRQMTGGKDLKICVTADATWPFPWYFRDFKNIEYPSSVPQGGGEYAAIVTDWYDEEKERKAVETVGPGYWMKRYHHRVWWAVDPRTVMPGYKTVKTLADLRDVVRDVQWSKIEWKKLWDLWAYRVVWPDSVNPQVVLGAQEMMLFVRRDLVHKYD